MIKCSKCDTTNIDEAKYCRHCGAKIKSNFVLLLNILLIISIIAILIIIVSYSYTPKDHISLPDDTSTESESGNLKKELISEVGTTTSTEEAFFSLTVSNSSLSFDSDGGNSRITISACGPWEINISTCSWGHLTRDGDDLIVRVDANMTNEVRTDYFEIKCGIDIVRVDITQATKVHEAAVTIDKIWQDHNVYNNGFIGMYIHVNLEVENMLNKTLYTNIYFFQGDNTTPIIDLLGSELTLTGFTIVNYESAKFTNMNYFLPYSQLNMAMYTNTTLSFDIDIRDSNDNTLARENNNRFIYKNF